MDHKSVRGADCLSKQFGGRTAKKSGKTNHRQHTNVWVRLLKIRTQRTVRGSAGQGRATEAPKHPHEGCEG